MIYTQSSFNALKILCALPVHPALCHRQVVLIYCGSCFPLGTVLSLNLALAFWLRPSPSTWPIHCSGDTCGRRRVRVGTVRAQTETCSLRDAHRLPSGVQPLEQMETSHPEIQRERTGSLITYKNQCLLNSLCPRQSSRGRGRGLLRFNPPCLWKIPWSPAGGLSFPPPPTADIYSSTIRPSKCTACL